MTNTLASRMKEYESVSQTRLARRVPVIIRVDGKAFHTLTKGMTRPFDPTLMDCMETAAVALCEKIQGAAFAYVQSDEISILLTDWDRYDTESWFDYRVQKVASVAASIATAYFNIRFQQMFAGTGHERKIAMFDARVANYPRHEVVNYFVWRQLDWVRNSVHMVGRAHFSAKRLHKQHSGKVREMLIEAGVSWDDLAAHLRLGTIICRQPREVPVKLDRSGGQVRLMGGTSPGEDLKIEYESDGTTIKSAKVTRMAWGAEKVHVPVFTEPEGRAWVEGYLTEVFWKEERPSAEDT